MKAENCIIFVIGCKNVPDQCIVTPLLYKYGVTNVLMASFLHHSAVSASLFAASDSLTVYHHRQTVRFYTLQAESISPFMLFASRTDHFSGLYFSRNLAEMSMISCLSSSSICPVVSMRSQISLCSVSNMPISSPMKSSTSSGAMPCIV